MAQGMVAVDRVAHVVAVRGKAVAGWEVGMALGGWEKEAVVALVAAPMVVPVAAEWEGAGSVVDLTVVSGAAAVVSKEGATAAAARVGS